MKEYNAKIYKIEKKVYTTVYVKQGIDKYSQDKYDNNPYYHGSNGTYGFGNETLKPELLAKIVIYDYYGKGNHRNDLTLDIYDYVLEKNNLVRLSDKALNYVIEKNTNKKIKVIYDKELKIDISQLDVQYRDVE